MKSRRRLPTLIAAAAIAACVAACDVGPADPSPSASSPTQGHTLSAIAPIHTKGVVVRSPAAPPAITVTPEITKSATLSAGLATATPKRWKPPKKSAWQWQLSGKLNTSVNVPIYDVDLFNTTTAQIKYLHSKKRKVVCYFSAGSYESGRPDSKKFPSAVKGKKMDGWPEYWLDIRDPRVLKIMAARMDLCKKKGFDGVEPDNVDGYQNSSGFRLTAADQLKYNKALAKLAHDRGLAIGLKNDLDQVKALQPYFDFAVNEECFMYSECSMLSPFIKAGKPVFHVEYELPLSKFCAKAKSLGFSSMLKTWDLTATRKPCPA